MRGTKCLYDSQRAICRAIVYPRFACQASRPIFTQHVPFTTTSPSAPRWPVSRQSRSFAGSTRSSSKSSGQKQADTPSDERDDPEKRGFDRRFTTARDIERSGRDRPPWDHEITDPQIMVIDNGVAEGPLSTRYVLTKLDVGESLRMISPYVPADAEKERQMQFAVCKIINKKEEYERQKQLKEKKKTAAASKAKTKELELTWAIGDHDLATKLRQMSGFLGKGMKVEVTIGKKKGGRQVEKEEAKEVLKKVKEEVEAAGAREVKAAEGQPGGTMRLYLEGKKTP